MLGSISQLGVCTTQYNVCAVPAAATVWLSWRSALLCWRLARPAACDCWRGATLPPSVLVPRLPERHSPLLVDSYTHELKQQHKMVSSQIRFLLLLTFILGYLSDSSGWVEGVKGKLLMQWLIIPRCSHSLHPPIRIPALATSFWDVLGLFETFWDQIRNFLTALDCSTLWFCKQHWRHLLDW